MNFIPAELIRKKRRGANHSEDEIAFLINGYTSGKIPDYQISAWLMAVCFQGMSPEEIAAMTKIMRDSGSKMDFSGLKMPCIDKHSTGGVGDKTSILIGPIMEAAGGVAVPMVAGRGLGHTGGTLDKLVSIPGFTVDLDIVQLQELVAKHRFAIMGQTEELCPADRKLYALRDVTGTVDSLPLICASIMSKKLAEDLDGLVLDVKFGSGAFMKTVDQAEELAQLLKSTGEANQVKVTAVLSNMNQPLGRYIGNALEIKECIDILKGESCIHNDYDYYAHTRELSLRLSGHMLFLGKQASSPEAGYETATKALTSGKAYDAFLELCKRQGPGDSNALPVGQNRSPILANRSGYISAMDTEKIGMAAVGLGAGRVKAEDSIDPVAGLEMNCYIGQYVEQGQPLFFVHTNHSSEIEPATKKIQQAVAWSDEPVPPQPLIAKILV